MKGPGPKAAGAAPPPGFMHSFSRRRWLAGSTALALTACAGTPGAPPAEGFLPWSERFAEDWMRLVPEVSTVSRYFNAEEQARLDGLSSEPGPALRERRRAMAREGLAQVDRHLAAGALAAAERPLALTLRWSLTRVLAAGPYEDHGFAFAQTFGAQVRYMNLFTEAQPLRRAADLAPFLARLRATPARLDAVVEQTRRAATRGLLPPRFIIERARTQVLALAEATAENEPVLTAFRRRIDTVPDLAAGARVAAVAQATQLVLQGIRPAWGRAAALLDELQARAGDDAGLWRLPAGDQAYVQALATNTTTTLSPEDIHTLGLAEVTRIEAEMDRVLKLLGKSHGTVNERVAAVRREHQPPADPDPRPMLLARYAEHVRDAERRAEALFNIKPRAAVEVRRVGPLTERSASAFYMAPPRDGSRPGQFWVPMPSPQLSTVGMRTLAVHEAVPGHHFQLALQQEAAALPKWFQQRVFSGGSAFTEGWALYAERLAIEEGWYEGDLPSLLGAWDAQLFRARRLVVDTGLHARRWSRQQAIDYGISASEVERYVVNPGQACAYMVGMLRILALRDEARTAQGVPASGQAYRLWLRDFHDVVLSTGSVPLDVLGDVVRAWSRQRPARA